MVRRGFGTAAALLPFAAAALAAGCAGGHHAHVSKHTAAKPTYAQLVGKNYKVLTPKQTRRFLRYADRVHACLAKRFRLAEPVASTTKIVMRLRTNA